MKVTDEYLKASGLLQQSDIPGEYTIEPPLEMICDTDGMFSTAGIYSFRAGDTVRADRYRDETSTMIPCTIHLFPNGQWWRLNAFSLK